MGCAIEVRIASDALGVVKRAADLQGRRVSDRCGW